MPNVLVIKRSKDSILRLNKRHDQEDDYGACLEETCYGQTYSRNNISAILICDPLKRKDEMEVILKFVRRRHGKKMIIKSIEKEDDVTVDNVIDELMKREFGTRPLSSRAAEESDSDIENEGMKVVVKDRNIYVIRISEQTILREKAMQDICYRVGDMDFDVSFSRTKMVCELCWSRPFHFIFSLIWLFFEWWRNGSFFTKGVDRMSAFNSNYCNDRGLIVAVKKEVTDCTKCHRNTLKSAKYSDRKQKAHITVDIFERHSHAMTMFFTKENEGATFRKIWNSFNYNFFTFLLVIPTTIMVMMGSVLTGTYSMRFLPAVVWFIVTSFIFWWFLSKHVIFVNRDPLSKELIDVGIGMYYPLLLIHPWLFFAYPLLLFWFLAGGGSKKDTKINKAFS